MPDRTIAVNRNAVLIVGALAFAGLALVWVRNRRARAAAAAAPTQQPSVSATAPAPIPYGANMPAVVDVVQGPPGTNARVTNLQTGQRVV